MHNHKVRKYEYTCDDAKAPVNFHLDDRTEDTIRDSDPSVVQLHQNSLTLTPKKRGHSSIKRNNIFPELVTNTELCKYLLLSNDIDDLKRRIILLIGKLGFSEFSFSLTGTTLEQSGIIYSLPSEFIENYYQNNYHKYDWLWNILEISDKGIFGSTLHNYVNAAPFLTEEIVKNREIIQLIKFFNFEDFYAVPAKSETGRKSALIIWGLNIAQSEFQNRIKLCEGRLELLCHAIDHVYSIRFEELTNKNRIIPPKLTSRPRELLTYMAFHDCTLYQAAERMHISVKTANVHIAAARKVLNVKTTTNAISRAIEYGLIKPDQERL